MFDENKYCRPQKIGNRICFSYTSYNKYFRLYMVSEELRLNEIGPFLK